MTEAETEARMREILGPGWKAPRTEHDRYNYAALRDEGDVPWIAKVGSFWQFAGAHPALRGECTVSADVDGIVLAERLASLVGPEQQAIAETEALFAEGEIEDYTLDPPALEGAAPADADFSEPEPEQEPTLSAQDRFIGLDDLDRRRSLRIGDTIRYAKTLMPFWTTDHQAALVELRNFAMGVAEKRWDDSAERQLQLADLEAVARRVREIEAARDAKVEFLEGASRDEVEAFDVEADWP